MKKVYNYYGEKQFGRLEKVKAQAIDERIRERYSISDEFAIQRQRDEKPEEFAEYYNFCEQVKAEVKAECEAHIAKYEKIFGISPS